MFLKPLLDLVFPPSCEVCRRRSDEVLCPDCFNQVKFMKPQFGVYSATAYAGVLRTALHRLKFQKRKRLAEPLGVVLVQYLSQTQGLKLAELDLIIPVPLHRHRYRQRGFNQAELLARIVGRYYELPVSNVLERVRNTHAQFDLPKEARAVNVKGAFKIREPQAVGNKKILLVDDIYTTGATIAECAKTLSLAGARRVEILTLTRAIEAEQDLC